VVGPSGKSFRDLRIVTRHGWREICGNRDDVNLAGYRLPTFVFINRIRKKSATLRLDRYEIGDVTSRYAVPTNSLLHRHRVRRVATLLAYGCATAKKYRPTAEKSS